MSTAIVPGSKHLFQGGIVRVLRLLDFDTVEIEDTNRKIKPVPRKALAPISTDTPVKDSNQIFLMSEKDFELASKRWAIIKPIIETPGDGKLLKGVAKANGIPESTLYRWVRLYRDSETIDSLTEGRGKALEGRKSIDAVLETIIKEAIEEKYMTRLKKSKSKVVEAVKAKCRAKKIKAPHVNTIYNRIRELDPREVTKAREGPRKAKDIYGARPGEFPDPVHALQVVQIDHTHVDVLVVDSTYRKVMKYKLILTTAMDVVTRMIVGYYLSFFKPGFSNAGLCISNAILPKESTLKRLNIPNDWPCWGKMAIVYTDNAKEFRGHSMKRACAKNGITISWRPRHNPRFAGHIESFQKTLMAELHNLPGSTFFNVELKGDYDSAGKARFTFDQIERYLVNFIVNIYHVRVHEKLGRPPIAAWKEQLVGTDSIPGIGFPEVPDEETTKIDFRPGFFRTVQNYGVKHAGITYFDNKLKPFIKATEKKGGRKLKEFEFRYDPRNITSIHLLHPETGLYDKIDLSLFKYMKLDLNLWDFKAYVKERRRLGKEEVDEERLFAGLALNEEIEKDAISSTEQIRQAHTNEKKKNSETKATNKESVIEEEDDPFKDLDLDSIKSY